MAEKNPPASPPAAPATPPEPTSPLDIGKVSFSDETLDQVRAAVSEAVREALAGDVVGDAVRAAFGEIVAEAEVRHAQIESDPYGDADVALEKRTIRHDLFAYDLPGGGQAIARRGDTVDLMAHDVTRGDKFEAFTGKVGATPDPPTASTLPAFPIEGTEAEQDAWMDSGTVPEIVATVNADPAILTAVLAAEGRRGEDKARRSLLEALGRMNSGD